MTSNPNARQRIGMKDVARRAGVSLSSVSRVLDDHPEVSEVMRNRVLDAVATLGYRPDPLARSLRTGSTNTIGFVAGDTSNPLIATIGAAAQLTLRDASYSLLVANAQSDPEQELSNIQVLDNRKVDGMLLSLSDESSAEVRGCVAELAAPVVLIDRELEGVDVSAVHSNHRTGIAAAVAHLRSLGHRRIALINGYPRVRPSRERAAALQQSLEGVEGAAAIVVEGSFTEAHGTNATMDLMQLDDPPTALIAGSNQILVGVLRALRELGMKFPDDVSLVTCDDTPLAELSEPRIATISRDAELIGVTAGKLLVRALAGQSAKVMTLDTRFAAAESCGPNNGGNPQ